MEKQTKQKDNKKRDTIIVIGLLLLLFLLALILFYLLLGGKGADGILSNETDKIDFIVDGNVTDGDIVGKSKDDIVDALNQKVQDGMINISMNTNPIFADGEAKGTLMITNSEINRYPQMIEIYTKDTNELIYSGGIEVGSKIETSTLSVDLPQGTYDCIAYFHAVDPDTGDRVGTAGADIKITILA